jgi:predicted flap endonuclease-1-like 5' DNA nuclease
MKNPPILIAIIGFFAALAGFAFLFFGLRMVGFDWFGALGDLPAFDHVGLWGWLAIVTGIVWILAALGLWALQPWARIFALFMAGFALFEAILAFFQFPGTGVGFSMAILPALILWYLNSSEVKAAFAEDELAPIAAPIAAAPAVAAPAVAAPAVAAPVVVAPIVPAPVVAAPAAAALVSTPMEAPAETAAVDPAEEPTAGQHIDVEDVEGIGPAQAQKLASVGIATTDDLLRAGATHDARERIAEATGISGKLIRDWVDKVDLMRVPGVGAQYSDLLEAAGVDSPAELAQRNPANLATTLQEVVAARPGIVRRVPTEAEIAGWIVEAGRLPKIVQH